MDTILILAVYTATAVVVETITSIAFIAIVSPEMINCSAVEGIATFMISITIPLLFLN